MLPIGQYAQGLSSLGPCSYAVLQWSRGRGEFPRTYLCMPMQLRLLMRQPATIVGAILLAGLVGLVWLMGGLDWIRMPAYRRDAHNLIRGLASESVSGRREAMRT